MSFIKSIGAYLTFIAFLAALFIILGTFQGIFELFHLGKWFSHGGSLQVCVISAIAAYYIGMTKYEKTAVGLWVIAVLAGLVTVGSWSVGH